MACDCIAVMNAKMADRNTRVATAFRVDRNGGNRVCLTVSLDVEKIDHKKRDKVLAVATFCPFCGVRYVAEPQPTTPDQEGGR